MKRKSEFLRNFRPLLLISLLGLCVGATLSPGMRASEFRLGYEPVMAEMQALLANGGSPAPDWETLFYPDGTPLIPASASGSPLQGGFEAVFIPDNISNGIGIDMSAFRAGASLIDSLVYNGTVSAGHDLGNAYFYAATNAQGHLMLYGAAERLGAPGSDSTVEFEFNQGVVQVWSGVPWPIHGERTAGDILLRINFAAGKPSSAEIAKWEAGDGGGFRILTTSTFGADQFCSGSAGIYAICNAPRLQLDPQAFIGPIRDQVYDASGNAVNTPAPNSLLNIAIDLTSALGSNIEISSIQIRTPEDIILGGFANMGYWKAFATNRNARVSQ